MTEVSDNLMISMFEEPEDFTPASRDERIEKVKIEDFEFDIKLVGEHALWGNFLCNAAKLLSEYFISNQQFIENKKVLELGAAGALPSIVCANLNAKEVVITDYPDEELMTNIQDNVDKNVKNSDICEVFGHLWGKKNDELSKKGKFDVIILSDLIFNHFAHEGLAASCLAYSKPNTKIFVAFSHHRPWLKEEDLNFFKKSEKFFEVEKVLDKKIGMTFPEDNYGEEEERSIFSKNYQKPPGAYTLIVRPINFFIIWNLATFSAAYQIKKREQFKPPKRRSYKGIMKYWNSLTESQQTLYSIVFVNSVVFLLKVWQIPNLRIRAFMDRNFLHNTLSEKTFTLLTSTFSHKHFLHFGFNMYALMSFGETIHRSLGREYFLSAYISSGIFASLISQIFRVILTRPALSLGASGSLMFLLGFTALLAPNAEIGLIFLPGISFPISYGTMGIVCFDILGVLFKWRGFDHFAHLGGILYSLLYFKFIQELMALSRNRKSK
eukprot:gene4478-7859_t